MLTDHDIAPTDRQLIERLRGGDESAFAELLHMYHSAMIRIAQLYVHDRAAAEEVAQETWIAVLQGIGRFEGRSSLKTWIFAILSNRAKTRGQRDGRTIPFSVAWDSDDEPAVDPDRFYPEGHPYSGGWMAHPSGWDAIPEEHFASQEVLSVVLRAIDMLSPNQRAVITLRDVEGLSADEVCNLLDITQTNQRVLLHRARARVQRVLERYFDEGQS